MKHDLFIDGTVKEYSWSIKTGNEVINQDREHPPAYLSGGKLEIKNNLESKFIAIHVGIYWGLGVFIIKDYDAVNIMCDSKEIYEILLNNKTDKGRWHLDSFNNQYKVFCFLKDVKNKNGALEVIPRTHRLLFKITNGLYSYS